MMSGLMRDLFSYNRSVKLLVCKEGRKEGNLYLAKYTK